MRREAALHRPVRGSSLSAWLLFAVFVFTGTYLEEIAFLSFGSTSRDTTRGLTTSTSTTTSVVSSSTKNRFHRLQHLRFAAFGSSRTYGIKLRNRTEDAYIGLLSGGQAHNYAIRATGPDYPGRCLSTMIPNDNDDEMYDVIVVDFHAYRFTVKAADDDRHDLTTLVTRLRRRFPAALIVFFEDWIPVLYYHKPTEMYFADYLQVKHPHVRFDMKNSTLYDVFFQDSDNKDWEYRGDAYTEEERALARSVGAIVATMPRHADSLLSTLHQYGHCIDPDLNHYTSDGHQLIAQTIHDAILGHFGTQLPVRSSSTRRNNNNNVQEGSRQRQRQDQCESVFNTGKANNVVYSEGVVIDEYRTDTFTYAVVSKPHVWFRLANNTLYPRPARLAVVYMALGKRRSFPDATITVASLPPRNVSTVHLDAAVGYNVNWMVDLGIVQSKEIHIRVDVPAYRQTSWPFRITGFTLTEVQQVIDNNNNNNIVAVS